METFVQGVEDAEEFSWTCACCIQMATSSPFLFETSDDYRCALQRVSSTAVCFIIVIIGIINSVEFNIKHTLKCLIV